MINTHWAIKVTITQIASFSRQCLSLSHAKAAFDTLQQCFFIFVFPLSYQKELKWRLRIETFPKN